MKTSLSLPLDVDPANAVRAIGLWQPFASLVADGWKSIETRLRRTHIRGRVVICATKGIAPPALYAETLRRVAARGIDPAPYAADRVLRGHALAIAELVDSRPMTDEDEPLAFVPRVDAVMGGVRWAWCLAPKPERVRPVAVKCAQGWFSLASSILIPEAA
jgi:hypothetical protein